MDQLPDIIKTLSSSAALLLSIVGVIVVFLTYLRRGRVKIGEFQLEFPREVTAGGDVIINQSPPPSEIPGGPGDRQYSLFQQYHSQGLAQAKISFWFSLVFASLGFLVIIVTLLTMNRSVALAEQGPTFVGLVSGTIIDAVAALFFVQSNKARHLMTEFFDKLRADRKFEESLHMSERIPDPGAQSRLKIMLALNFADVTPSDNVIREILGMQGTTEIERVESTPNKAIPADR